MFGSQIQYKKDRVYRVKANYVANGYSCGSGFFINKTEFVTCFHVVLGGELRNFRLDQNFTQLQGATEHEKLETSFRNRIASVQIEIKDGEWVNGTLKSFDELHDVAIIEVESQESINVCEVDFNPTINYGDYVVFGGYPTRTEYDADKAPIAVQEGMVSSFPETQIGGEKYQHIQLNSINLGGNSGAPLFKKKGSKVIGIINGNMIMGNDNILFQNPQTNQIIRNSLRIPVGIAYATSFELLKKESPVFSVPV